MRAAFRSIGKAGMILHGDLLCVVRLLRLYTTGIDRKPNENPRWRIVSQYGIVDAIRDDFDSGSGAMNSAP